MGNLLLAGWSFYLSHSPAVKPFELLAMPIIPGFHKQARTKKGFL